MVVASSGCAKHTVTPIDKARSSRPGVVYALPRGVLVASFTVSRTETKLSPFADVLLALPEDVLTTPLPRNGPAQAAYLNAAGAFFKAPAEDTSPQRAATVPAGDTAGYGRLLWHRIRQDSGALYYLLKLRSQFEAAAVSPALSRGVGIKVTDAELSVVAEPDPKAVYVARLDSGLLVDRTLDMDLTDRGLLQKGESKSANKAVDLGIQITKTAAEVAGAIIGARSEERVAAEPHSALFDRVANSDDWLTDSKYTKLRQAESRITQVTKLANTRINTVLGAGRTKLSDHALDLWLEDNSKSLVRASSYFASASETKPQAVRMLVRPATVDWDTSPDVSNTVVLMKVEPSTGKIWINSPRLTTPFPAAWQGSVSANAHEYKLHFARLKNGPDEAVFAANRAEEQITSWWPRKRGFYYRLPGRAKATLTHSGGGTDQPLALGEFAIPQFGPTLALPEHTGSLDSTYTLSLHDDLGSIKKITVVSKAVQLQQVQALGDAAKAIQAAEEADETDELDALKRRREILDEKIKIRDLEEKLNAGAE